ncbi:MAG TPA: DUF4388 domain-containing protein [Ktedonobacteraceae bacterium]|nr:DUF4388 domain-containing protein [Ktedonobacteraceae bacterium]
MMLRRVTTMIDSLASIIRTLSDGGMSGHLIARRRNGGQSEDGEIFFVHGKIIDAKTADRVGIDALNWMKTWKDCIFSFRPSRDSEHIPVLSPEVLRNQTNAQPTKEATEPRQTSPIRKLARVLNKEPENANSPVVDPETLLPEAIPYRAEDYDKALQLMRQKAYSRVHLHIFLLVDGHRSVAELIRLTSRRKDQIVRLLRDLETLGVIYIPR